jgi:hypothetical protein
LAVTSFGVASLLLPGGRPLIRGSKYQLKWMSAVCAVHLVEQTWLSWWKKLHWYYGMRQPWCDVVR